MSFYKNIKDIDCGRVNATSNVLLSYKKLRLFGAAFILFVTSGMFGLSLSNLQIASEVRQVTQYWAFSPNNVGKLKYVNVEDVSEREVLSYASEMQMPFNNTYITAGQVGSYIVNGLGGVVVKSCLDGVVANIETYGVKKTIYVKHTESLMTVYEGLDSVGVEVGNKVNKNEPLGINYQSQIIFKIMYKNKIMTGLTVKDGELSFM